MRRETPEETKRLCRSGRSRCHLLHAQRIHPHGEHVVTPEAQHRGLRGVIPRHVVQEVPEGNVTRRVVAQVDAVQPHVRVLVHAVKVDPHGGAVSLQVDGEVPPIPRHVEGKVPVLLVVLRRVPCRRRRARQSKPQVTRTGKRAAHIQRTYRSDKRGTSRRATQVVPGGVRVGTRGGRTRPRPQSRAACRRCARRRRQRLGRRAAWLRCTWPAAVSAAAARPGGKKREDGKGTSTSQKSFPPCKSLVSDTGQAGRVRVRVRGSGGCHA